MYHEKEDARPSISENKRNDTLLLFHRIEKTLIDRFSTCIYTVYNTPRHDSNLSLRYKLQVNGGGSLLSLLLSVFEIIYETLFFPC